MGPTNISWAVICMTELCKSGPNKQWWSSSSVEYVMNHGQSAMQPWHCPLTVAETVHHQTLSMMMMMMMMMMMLPFTKYALCWRQIHYQDYITIEYVLLWTWRENSLICASVTSRHYRTKLLMYCAVPVFHGCQTVNYTGFLSILSLH